MRRLVLLLLLLVLAGAGCGEESGAVRPSDYLKSGDYQAARDAYEAQITAGADTEENLRGLGIACMGLGDYDHAAYALEEALTKAAVIPTAMEYDVNRYLSACYYKLGRYEDAMEVYDAIITLHPRDPDAYLCRGTIRIAMGDLDGMAKDFGEAIALDPDGYDRISSIYEMMEKGGYAELGREYLRDILNSRGDSMDAFNYGRLSYYVGNYSEARTSLEKVRESGDYRVTILFGKTYEALGDFNYAKSVYETYLQKEGDRAEVYNQLGLCCIRMQDYKGALDAFQKGLLVENSGIEQGLLFNQVIACEYLGDFQRARGLMEVYTAKYPGDEKAQREYVFLKTR